MSDHNESEISEATATARTVLILVAASLVFSIVCFGVAFSILPDYCALFSSNVPGGFECDGFDFRNPQPCQFCEDRSAAIASQVFAGLGIAFLILPGLVFILKHRYGRIDESTKIRGLID